MTRDGWRGFVRRSLPVLLALLLTGPFSAAAVVPAAYEAASPVAAVVQVDAAPGPEPSADPVEPPAATVVVAGAPQVLHAQVIAGVRGSRAPPFPRA